jgi:hypothetical protein
VGHALRHIKNVWHESVKRRKDIAKKLRDNSKRNAAKAGVAAEKNAVENGQLVVKSHWRN